MYFWFTHRVWHRYSTPPASSLMQLNGENQCLKAAQDCGLYEKCGSLRSEYVLACTKKVPGTNRCNQQKCHRTLRRFLERVPEEYSLPVLFCPCTSTLCGERRRKNIVPSCSYQQMEGSRYNCLQQQSICRQDDLCRWNRHWIYFFDWTFNAQHWRIQNSSFARFYVYCVTVSYRKENWKEMMDQKLKNV